jgi:hypothetical protein
MTGAQGVAGLVASMTATSTSKRPDADARSARYKRVAGLKLGEFGRLCYGIGDLCGQVRAPACFLADDRGHLGQPEDKCSCPFPGLTEGRPGAVVSCGNRNLSCLGCRDARRERVRGHCDYCR